MDEKVQKIMKCCKCTLVSSVYEWKQKSNTENKH